MTRGSKATARLAIHQLAIDRHHLKARDNTTSALPVYPHTRYDKGVYIIPLV